MISFIKGKKCSNLPGTKWKSNCISKSNNWLCHPFQQQLQSSVCGILSHSSLQNCFNSATLEGFLAWMDCLRSCHSISIGFKSGLWFGHSKTLILFFLSHSEVDLLLCLGSLSCCITQVHLSLRSHTAGRIECRIHGSINYGKSSSRSWSCKAAPDHHTTTTMFECWYDFLFMKCCVDFMPDVTGHTPSKKFNFCLISPQNICPKVLDELLLSSWSNFGRPATPGKVHHCSKFSPFVDNGSDCGSLESQSLRNGFITLSRLIHVNYFVSHMFLNFFRSRHDVLLFKHAPLCQTGSI